MFRLVHFFTVSQLRKLVRRKIVKLQIESLGVTEVVVAKMNWNDSTQLWCSKQKFGKKWAITVCTELCDVVIEVFFCSIQIVGVWGLMSNLRHQIEWDLNVLLQLFLSRSFWTQWSLLHQTPSGVHARILIATHQSTDDNTAHVGWIYCFSQDK